MSTELQRALLSVPEAARTLGVSLRTMWRLIAAGEIRAVRLRGRTLIPVSELGRIAAGTTR